jgi:hypothetical protein
MLVGSDYKPVGGQSDAIHPMFALVGRGDASGVGDVDARGTPGVFARFEPRLRRCYTRIGCSGVTGSLTVAGGVAGGGVVG